MSQRSLLLLGATGAVGSDVLALALADPAVSRVVAPTRRPLPEHAKLLNPIVDFAALPDADWWRTDACICTLGTTMKRAGSKEAFERIDRCYVTDAARRTLAAGTPCFAYNSSLGANEKARNFYLRMKGLTEKDLANLGFASLTLVRPSMLDRGPRAKDRPAERVTLFLFSRINQLLPAGMRIVKTQSVARALLSAAFQQSPGLHVVESRDLHSDSSDR